MTHFHKKTVLILFTIVMISGCASQASRHNIAGTTYGWSKNGITVLSDIEVSGLQVRHVRTPSSICTSGYADHLELNGPIGPDSTFVMEQLLKKVEKCIDKETKVVYSTRVYMNSNGGLLKDGYSLGRILRNTQAQTVVSGDQVCASACAVAFLGGRYRNVEHNGELFFHSPYIKYIDENIKCASRKESGELNKYYHEMLPENYAKRVFSRTMDYCSVTEGWTVNKDAAEIFHISSDDKVSTSPKNNVEMAIEAIKKEIPEWNDEMYSQAMEYAIKKMSFSENFVASSTDPEFFINIVYKMREEEDYERYILPTIRKYNINALKDEKILEVIFKEVDANTKYYYLDKETFDKAVQEVLSEKIILEKVKV